MEINGMSKIEKMDCSYSFSKTYKLENGEEKKCTIHLHINYQTKTYSIVPTHSNVFQFTNSSKWEMWKTVVSLINFAIDFANDLIKKEDANAK